MLTSDQIAHFETFGFLVLRQLFTPEEITIMKREAEEIYYEDRGGEPFTGEETQSVQPFFERKPYLSQLVDDDRIYSIGEDLMGPDFILDGTEGRMRVKELHAAVFDWVLALIAEASLVTGDRIGVDAATNSVRFKNARRD